MVTIQLVSAEIVWPLRYEILRPHQPFFKSQYSSDNDESTFHLAAINEHSEVVGVASFAKERSNELSEENAFRLRGMATSPKVRRQGIGRQLIERGELELKKRKVKLVWFNARQVAFRFYESCGYLYCSEIFEIEDIGPHRIMYKWLNV